ncbi:hypothetical protein BsWGS_24345 [Bradybaena similaris]
MNVSTTNYTALERQKILHWANENTFRQLIPTISFYSGLVILGVTGNILSIYIFTTQMLKNQQNELFILLSIFNLLACGVCLPLDIFDMRNMHLYSSTVLCKMARFLNVFTMVSSTLTLTVLAIFRLRAAKSGPGVSSTRCRRIVGLVILVFLSASVSWIAAVVFGIRSSPTFIGDITGRDCSVADDTSGTAWPSVFNYVFGIGFASLQAVTTTAYYRIWRMVRKSRNTVKAYTKTLKVLPRGTDERKADLPFCEKKNIITPNGDINEKKAGLFIYEDRHLIVSPDESNDRKVDLSPYEDQSVSHNTSTGQNRNKQQTRVSIVKVLVDDSIYMSFKNDVLTHDKSQYYLTPTVDSATLNADHIIKTSNDSRLANDSNVKFTSTPVCAISCIACNTPCTTKNKATKDVRMSLENTTNTHRTLGQPREDKPCQPGEDKHKLKRRLSKTSLEAAVTRTAFLLTLTFIVSYLPFFLVSIPRAIDKDMDYSQDAVKVNLVNFAIRLYFIMPAVSPAIFWASNLDFRRKCKALCSK